MHTTIGRHPLTPPRLAVPPPARRAGSRSASRAARIESAYPRALYRRHAATFGAIALVTMLVALLDWLIAPASADALPLWLVLVAGAGALTVGTTTRRLDSGDRPRPHPADATPSAPADERTHEDAELRGAVWRRSLYRVVAAVTAGAIMLALATTGDARALSLGVGLAGVLALRLAVPPVRGATHRAAVVELATTPARVAEPTLAGADDDDAPDLTDDVLMGSFPASDPPSWGKLRPGGPRPAALHHQPAAGGAS